MERHDYSKTKDKRAPRAPVVHDGSPHWNNDYFPQMQHQLDIQNVERNGKIKPQSRNRPC